MIAELLNVIRSKEGHTIINIPLLFISAVLLAIVYHIFHRLIL